MPSQQSKDKNHLFKSKIRERKEKGRGLMNTQIKNIGNSEQPQIQIQKIKNKNEPRSDPGPCQGRVLVLD